jgi:VIT1/CCC1 family predicted Fe2+/Mn2+ transporter
LKDEFTDHTIYRELARREKSDSRRRLLEQLAATEMQHYEFWRRYSEGYAPRVSPLYVKWLILLRFLFGLTFTLKLLERHERRTIAAYKRFLLTLPEGEGTALEAIIREEEGLERHLISEINEKVVKYMSFIVLGLADAIVEITGVHAGFLGVTNSTLIAGVAGLVVGFAAAISMASAAYLHAKHETAKSPSSSAFTTGVAYLAAVALLAFPYFLTGNMQYAFGGSIGFAVMLIAGFTFYGAVLTEKGFMKEFAQSVALTLGTAFATFVFGDIVGDFFAVRNLLIA